MNSLLRIEKKSPLWVIIFEYIWAIAVILEGNSVYRHLTNRYLHLTFICLSVSVLLFIVRKKFFVSKRALLVGFFMFSYLLIYLLMRYKEVSIEVFVSTLLIGLPIMIMLFSIYVEEGNPYRLFICMSNVIFILTIFSLLAWLFGTILGILPISSSVRITWGMDKVIRGYFGLQYDVAKDSTYGIIVYRNQGIFTEAPMLSLWICISLATEIFLNVKPSKLKSIVYILGILSTVSTTGIIFCFFVLILFYLEMIFKGNLIRQTVLMLLLAVLIPLGYNFLQMIYIYKSSTISFTMRFQDYLKGFSAFKKYPIFGCGFGNISSIMTTAINGSKGYSNSIMALLATGGLWITVIFVISIVGYIWLGKNSGNNRVSKFGICYLFLYMTTIFFARYISVVLIAFGLLFVINFDRKGISEQMEFEDRKAYISYRDGK